MLKLTTPKCGELLRIFPFSVKEGVMYAVERHLEPNFKIKPWDCMPLFTTTTHHRTTLTFFFLFFFLDEQEAAQAVYQEEIYCSLYYFLICWWPFVVWATTKSLLCGWLFRFPRILNYLVYIKYPYTPLDSSYLTCHNVAITRLWSASPFLTSIFRHLIMLFPVSFHSKWLC